MLPLALIVLLLWAHALYYNYTTDDAFISFRYVRNMLDGRGLVYNPGERVEGYTNFLWAMLLALPAALGLKIETAARLLGLLFGAVTLVVVTATARLWLGGRLSARGQKLLLLPAALLAASGPLAMWALGGLETVFFTFLLMLATFVHLTSIRPRVTYAVGALLALLVMTRPDGVMFLAAIMIHVAAGMGPEWEDDSFKRRLYGVARLLAAFSILYLPYFFWRFSYYGYLLPNTFYAKVGGGSDTLLRGLKYVWLFISVYGFVPLTAASSFFYARMQQPQIMGGAGGAQPGADQSGYPADRRISSLLFLQIALYLLFIIFVGGDQLVMYRFFVPVLPALYLLTSRAAIELLLNSGPDETSLSRKIIAFAASAAIISGVIALPSFVGREHTRIFNVEKPADADRKALGEWLRGNMDAGATIALIPAGIAPYYSGLRTIDLVGLNDARIAHTKVPGFGAGEAGHEKYNSAYVLERRPDLVFLGACRIWPEKLAPEVLQNYYWVYGRLAPGTRDILQLKGFKENYSPYAARIGSGYVHFYKRNDFRFPPAESLISSTETG